MSREYHIGKIDPARLAEVSPKAAKSAPGTDLWSPADFRILPDIAFVWLARLLDFIQGGVSWPAARIHSNVAYMEKVPDGPMNPLAYQVLQLLPTLYGRWVTTLLKDLEGWIEGWAKECMFAGTAGQGAPGVAVATALPIEPAKI